MVVANKIYRKDGSSYTEYKGLDNDPRPINARENDIFMELNTDSIFKLVNGKWEYYPAYDNGGSGSSEEDISMVDVYNYNYVFEATSNNSWDVSIQYGDRWAAVGVSWENDAETGDGRLVFHEFSYPEEGPSLIGFDEEAVRILIAQRLLTEVEFDSKKTSLVEHLRELEPEVTVQEEI